MVKNFQLKVKENSVHSTKGTKIQLKVKRNSVHNTKATNIQLPAKKTVHITLK